MDAFIGIDVAVAKNKYCPISICVKDNGILKPLLLSDEPEQPPLGQGNIATLYEANNRTYALAIKKYIISICELHNLKPARIAIDAPLKPRAAHLSRRLAEQALDKLGMSCYTTPSRADFERIFVKAKTHIANGGQANKIPHSMQIFMLGGFAIAKALKEVAPCIEIYPHATAKLLGVAGKHKMKDDQALVQLNAISKYTGWPNSEEQWKHVAKICKGPTHDKIDAYSAAWLASLPEEKRQALGDPSKDDAIWVPRLNELALHKIEYVRRVESIASLTDKRRVKPKSTSSISVDAKVDSQHRRLCPACNAHWFKRWPFGWDAHAAHKCAGIEGGDIITRKRIYKEKFLN